MNILDFREMSSKKMSVVDYKLNIKILKENLTEAINASYELVMPEKLEAWKAKVEQMVKSEEISDGVFREKVEEAFLEDYSKKVFNDRYEKSTRREDLFFSDVKEEVRKNFSPDVNVVNYQSYRNIMNNKKNRVCALLEAFNSIAGYLNSKDKDKLTRAFTVFDVQASDVKGKLFPLILTYVNDGVDFYCSEYGIGKNSREAQLIEDTKNINKLISQGKTYEEAMEEVLDARTLTIDEDTFNVILNKNNNEFEGVDLLDSGRIVEGNLLENGNIILQISKGKTTENISGRVGENSISLKPIIGFGEEDKRILKKKVELFKAGKKWKGVIKSMKHLTKE